MRCKKRCDELAGLLGEALGRCTAQNHGPSWDGDEGGVHTLPPFVCCVHLNQRSTAVFRTFSRFLLASPSPAALSTQDYESLKPGGPAIRTPTSPSEGKRATLAVPREVDPECTCLYFLGFLSGKAGSSLPPHVCKQRKRQKRPGTARCFLQMVLY